MNSTERVRAAILGKEYDRQPIYGWVYANLTDQITERFGSVAAFEDKYEFDAAHIFGAPRPWDKKLIEKIASENDELTPDLLLCDDLFTDPTRASYEKIKASLAHHKERGRFCYMQTPGFFENFNNVFGIENQLMWLVLYTEELNELYRRQAEWTCAFADRAIDLGIDMIHISDDWGSQKDMMFNPEIWREIIKPHLRKVIDHVHSRGALCSLHSDGCISKVTDELAELGIDLLHPWQESAGMSYDLYLEKYADSFAIMGGVCVQTAIGILPQDQLEAEIRRVFKTLKGKRWVACTSHFVQDHCSIEDLEFAFDLIYKLARE
jgi:uroporphyrinogen decarboxylase